jgi:hypothetical protein
MHTTYEIESKLKAYLARAISLDELRAWFKSAFGDLMGHEPGSRPLELATVLELGLIEFERGVLSERQFRRDVKLALTSNVDSAIHDPNVYVAP